MGRRAGVRRREREPGCAVGAAVRDIDALRTRLREREGNAARSPAGAEEDERPACRVEVGLVAKGSDEPWTVGVEPEEPPAAIHNRIDRTHARTLPAELV